MERERQRRWDLDNLRSVGTKMTNGQYLMVRKACEIDEISVYALTKKLLFAWLINWTQEHPDRVQEVTGTQESALPDV